MLHNLFWLTVCVLLVVAAFRLVCWASRFPAAPAPQQEPTAAAPTAQTAHRRRRQAKTADDSAFTRAA